MRQQHMALRPAEQPELWAGRPPPGLQNGCDSSRGANFIIEREKPREPDWEEPGAGIRTVRGGTDGVKRGRKHGTAARDIPKLPGHAERASEPRRPAEVAAGISH